ncbi:MAG: dimethylmenaquinone methyltransferase [Acidobacteria bacterium]|nr:MAG: dimethylmenaquinone methyltransferase [Acidobacteriota bacterium]
MDEREQVPDSDNPSGSSGARVEAAQDQIAASKAVRQMFSNIAPRYDLLNHVLSLNVDRYWWWRTARRFRSILRRSDASVLDLCCGTGDMTLALFRQAGSGGACIVGADFAHPMLCRAARKSAGLPLHWVEADALEMPFADARFDLVTSAFGFRNLANYDAGLREIRRVLTAGGEVAILDFGEPKGLLGKIYRYYFRCVLPAIGTVLSGVKGPYAYLPASVARFPQPQEMLSRMKTAGFGEVNYTPYTFGISGVYWGKK